MCPEDEEFESEQEPTDEQMERHRNPNWEVDEHQARIKRINAGIIAQGRVPTLRDTYDPRLDGPW